MDAQTLKHSHAGRCELEHGPPVAAETARRLACDASLVAIIENEQGDPLSVGGKTRTIWPAIRRALNSRDKGCRFPGCTFTRYVDGHHVKHWAHGGDTKLANLVTLCRFHHRLVHEGRVSPAPQTTDWAELVALQEAEQICITPQTAVTGWTGEALDYDLAVSVLMQGTPRSPVDQDEIRVVATPVEHHLPAIG